jgi:hypothetical protein
MSRAEAPEREVSMRRAAVIAVLVAAAVAVGCGDDSSLTFFDATLRPENEVPARSSPATGTARFTFDGTTVTYTVTAANLANFTMGHIHSGAAGTNGPVRVFLYGPEAPASVGATTSIAEGSFTAANVTGIEFDALIEEMRAGTAYVNFHTTLYPGGEIRGQVRLLE